MKIEWSFTDTGLQVHVHQEAFVSELLSRHNLSECNISPRATPFKSGFPVDCIPPSNLSVTNQAKLTTPYQQLMGDLTWLSISTRPDVTAILSLLSEHTHTPSQAHLTYALHVVKYLASTKSLGLLFSSDSHEPLHSFVHFKDASNTLQVLCDANWGPMDASKPKPTAPPVEQSIESLWSISGWLALHSGAPIAWGCLRHKQTAQSSCEAEVQSINEATKLILQLKLLFRDLSLPISTPVPLYNDNQGAVHWSKGTTTKKMKWIDLRENFVRENVINKNIAVTHIPGTDNLSDIFTKEFRDVSWFLALRNSFMIDSVKFRS